MAFLSCCTFVADPAAEHVVSVGMEEQRSRQDSKAEKKQSKGILKFAEQEDVVNVTTEPAEEGDDEYVEDFKTARTQTKRQPKAPDPDDEEEDGAMELKDRAQSKTFDDKKRNNTSLMSKFNPNHGLRNEKSVYETEGAADSRYKMQDLLGAGGFGEVFKVQPKTDSSKTFAMKNIPTGNVPDLSRFELELEISKKLNHPNIVKLHETIRDESTYYLIMDLLSGGDLFDLIIDNGGLQTAEAGRILWQMLAGVIYLHHYKFVHRDIKPENYMLESKTGPRVAKLIDFGLAREYKVGSSELMTSKVGTRNYMGPEVWQQRNKGYNEQCDMWSVGVTLFVMLVANFPWNAKNDATFLKQITDKEPKYDTKQWRNHPQVMQNIVKKMLNKDYKSRASAKDCIPDVEAHWPMDKP